MGGTGSSAKDPAQKQSEATKAAIQKCNSTLAFLTQSVQLLTNRARSETACAVEHLRRKERQFAVMAKRRALASESTIKDLMHRMAVVEKHKSMLEQQQINAALTAALVQSSKALHSNVSMMEACDDALDEVGDNISDAYDAQYSVSETLTTLSSHNESAEDEELLKQMEAAMDLDDDNPGPPKAPLPEPKMTVQIAPPPPFTETPLKLPTTPPNPIIPVATAQKAIPELF